MEWKHLKNAVFSKKTVKNCFGGTLDDFLGKRRRLSPKINITFFLSQMRCWIFHCLAVLTKKKKKKKVYFLRNWQKTVSGALVSFEGKGASGDKNEYNLFYQKLNAEYFYVNNFFGQSIFWGNCKKLFLWAHLTIF